MLFRLYLTFFSYNIRRTGGAFSRVQTTFWLRRQDQRPANVSNQQKWHTLRPERSGVLWRSCKLPDFPVVLSSPFNGLSLYLPSAL